jgi:amino acid transporter
MQYLEQIYELNGWEKLAIITALVILVYALNILSLQVVGGASVLFTIAVLAPYILEPILSFKQFNPANLSEVVNKIDYRIFLNTILWNFAGWDSLGCVAGEVKNPSRSYPLGISFAIVLVSLNYIVPVMIASMLDNNWDNYEEGYFINIGSNIYPWLGQWILIAATISAIGSLNVVFSTASRALWRAARYGMVPQRLAGQWKKQEAPIVALTIHVFTTIIIGYFGTFKVVVVLDNFLNCVSLIFELFAFLWLKWKHPEIDRPVEVPGGMIGALIISIPKAALLVVTIGVADPLTWAIAGGLISFSVLLYPLWIRGHLKKISKDWHPTSATSFHFA